MAQAGARLFCQDVATSNPLLAPWRKAQKGQTSLGHDRVIRKAPTPKTLTLTLNNPHIRVKTKQKVILFL